MNTLELWLTKCILSIPYLRCCCKGGKVILVRLGWEGSQGLLVVHLVVLPRLVAVLIRLLAVLVLLLRLLELVLLLLLQLDVGGPVPLVCPATTFWSNTATRQGLGLRMRGRVDWGWLWLFSLGSVHHPGKGSFSTVNSNALISKEMKTRNIL